MPIGTGALIGAGLGAAGGIGKAVVGGQKAERERQLAAATQRYSPWTGMQAKAPEEENAFGDIASGLAGGAALGQNIAAAAPKPFTGGSPMANDFMNNADNASSMYKMPTFGGR